MKRFLLILFCVIGIKIVGDFFLYLTRDKEEKSEEPVVGFEEIDEEKLMSLPPQSSLDHKEKIPRSVLVATDSDFESVIKNYEYALVEFYAPWCPHCQKLEPEFAKAARVLGNIYPEVALVKVDATVNKKLRMKYQIKGYPTLLLFTKGLEERIRFQGRRDSQGIVEWMKSQVKVKPSEMGQKLADAIFPN